MWSIWLIVGVAAGAAVTLMVGGIIVGVIVEKKRYRRWMKQHGLEQVMAEANQEYTQVGNSSRYSGLTSQRASLPRSNTARTCSTIPLDNHLQSDMAVIPEDATVEDTTHTLQDKKRFRLYDPPLPKTSKRQKKKTKVTLKKHLTLSPLSAITESAKSVRMSSPKPVELPTSNMEPRQYTRETNRTQSGTFYPQTGTSDMDMRQDEQRIGSYESAISSENVSRITSIGDMLSCAPELPLPPLPNDSINKQHRKQHSRSRTSAGSIDTVSSSVLGPILVSPPRAATTQAKTQSQAFKEFDFGLANGTASQRTSALQKARGGRPGQDFRAFPKTHKNVRSTSSRHLDRTESSDSLKTIDASTWTLRPVNNEAARTPNSYRRSKDGLELSTSYHSIADREGVNKMRGSRLLSPAIEKGASFEDAVASRPVSIASLEMLRDSAGSPSSVKKGHRRQNCVRIKSLTPVDSHERLSRYSYLAELKEEENNLDADTPALSTVDVEEGQKVRSARPSIIEISSSPSPMKARRTNMRRDSSVDSEKPRLDSEVFNVFKDRSSPLGKTEMVTTNDNKVSPLRSHPLEPVSPGNVKFNLTPSPGSVSKVKSKLLMVENSPILPSPAYEPSKLFNRTSLVKGPRNLPPSYRPNRRDSVSPLKSKGLSSNKRKTNDADLRRSIAILRGMSSDAQLGHGSPSKINESAVESVSGSLSPASLDTIGNIRVVQPTLQRKRSSTISAYSERSSISKRLNGRNATSPNNKVLTMPPSRRNTRSSVVSSYSESSIWEDMSVRTSPEPDLPTPTKTPIRKDSLLGHEELSTELGLFHPKPQYSVSLSPHTLKPEDFAAIDEEAEDEVEEQSRKHFKKASYDRKELDSPTRQAVGLGLRIKSRPWS